MKTQISLLKLRGLVVDSNTAQDNRTLAYSLNIEMMRLGFVMTRELMDALSSMDNELLRKLAKDTIKVLKETKGDTYKHQPMYKNFPKQVMEMDELELYFNAIVHYWTFGQWMPEHKEQVRGLAVISNKLQSISLLTEDQFNNFFTKLLSSNDSLSAGDKNIVEWYLNHHTPLIFPGTIPYKETLCMVAAHALNKGIDITDNLICTTTDVLRLATYLSGGDVSLTTNTKFISFSRSMRRRLVLALEKVISEEDVQRHKNKWIKLFHSLHVCEYSNKVCRVATKARTKGNKLYSLMSVVEALLKQGDFVSASEILTKRPGDFARKMDHLVRDTATHESLAIMENFQGVADQVSTRVLAQLMGHFKTRSAGSDRIIFPKGSLARAQRISAPKGAIDQSVIDRIMQNTTHSLMERFEKLEPLGKVYIDPLMARCPLPAAQRSASEGSNIVARGTRVPLMGDGNTIRLFIHWVGQDIDLSATLHAEDLSMLGQVSYTNLREKAYQACHSGDITYAPGPKGASEFIDITIDKLMEHKIRYVVMNVYVFNGPNFGDHERCFAGWMMRDEPNRGAIFDPRAVQSKVDVTAQSRIAIPVIFDVATREAIWCDLTATERMNMGHQLFRGNNVESNRATITQVADNIMNLHNRFTLYDLFTLHGLSRGIIIEDKNEADIVFGWEGHVTPYDINTINSDYLI